MKYTAESVKVIEEFEPEKANDANILKYIFDLKEFGGVRIFAPSSVYKGGWYPRQNLDCLEVLEKGGVLQRRNSERKDINTRIYEFASRYEDFVNYSEEWEDIFVKFCKELTPNLFENHYRKRILPWIADESSYRWVTPDPDFRDPTTLASPNCGGHDDVGDIRSQIHNFDRPTREAGVILYRLLRDYKEIESATVKSKVDAIDQSALRLSVEYAVSIYEDHPPDALGKFVFYTGFFDLAEENHRDPGSEIAYLREHPSASDSIGVKLHDSLDLSATGMYEHSAGVLGITREYQGELVVTPVAILESDRLPDTLLEHQKSHRIKKIEALQEEQNNLIEDIAEDIDSQELSVSTEEIEQIIDQKLKDNNISDGERSAYEYFKHLLVTRVATKGIDWVITKMAQKFPDYIISIIEAIEL